MYKGLRRDICRFIYRRKRKRERQIVRERWWEGKEGRREDGGKGRE